MRRAAATVLLMAVLAAFLGQVEAQWAFYPGSYLSASVTNGLPYVAYTGVASGSEARFVLELCTPNATVTMRVSVNENTFWNTSYIATAGEEGYAVLTVPLPPSGGNGTMLYAELTTTSYSANVNLAMNVDAPPFINYAADPTSVVGSSSQIAARFLVPGATPATEVKAFVHALFSYTPLYSYCYLSTLGSEINTTTTILSNSSSVVEFETSIADLPTNFTFKVVLFAVDPSGARTVAPVFPVSTITMANCQLPTGLSFCTSLTKAVYVPSDTTLTAMDNRAKDAYDQFAAALAQFDCANQRYSLIRSCTDCADTYHEWICQMEFQECDTTSSSTEKAVLKTCQEYCWDTRQSCPNFLQFECPDLGSPTAEATYRDCTSSASTSFSLMAMVSASLAAVVATWASLN